MLYIYRIENLYWMTLSPTAKELGLQFLLITFTLSPPPMYLSHFLTSLIHFTTSLSRLKFRLPLS